MQEEHQSKSIILILAVVFLQIYALALFLKAYYDNGGEDEDDGQLTIDESRMEEDDEEEEEEIPDPQLAQTPEKIQ